MRGYVALIGSLLVFSTAMSQLVPQGNRTIIVLSAQYLGTPTPALTDVQWSTVFTNTVTPHYSVATNDSVGGVSLSNLTFTFVPASTLGGPPTYPIPFGPGTSTDDPTLIAKEGLAVLTGFDLLHAGMMLRADRRHFLIMVNSTKRGQATTVFPFRTSTGIWVNLAVTVFDEPVGAAFNGAQVTVPRLDLSGSPVLDDSGVPIRDIESRTVQTCAHELAHLVGLPDLYREDTNLPDFMGQWCPMDDMRMNNFCGWSRQYQGWLSAGRIFVPPMPAPGGTFDGEIDLFPAGTIGDPGQVELIMIPHGEELRDWSATMAAVGRLFGITAPGGVFFTGLLIEHRRQSGQDISVTTATDPSGASLDLTDPLGLRLGTDEGIVVSRANPWVPSLRMPPFNPVTAIPVPTGDDVNNAAFEPGEEYRDDQRGLHVQALALNPDGSMRVRVRWTVPPRPDITLRDAWIDSPGNGFGVFFFGGGTTGSNPPLLSGDRVFVPILPVWSPGLLGIPYLTFVRAPVPHRVQLRIRNSGPVPVSRIRGTLVLLEPLLLPLGFLDPINLPLSLLTMLPTNPLTTVVLDTSVPGTFAPIGTPPPGVILNPGQEGNFTVAYSPGAPFMVAAILDRVEAVSDGTTGGQTEPVATLWNNWMVEPFLLFTTSPGSPYGARSLNVPFGNPNIDRRVLMATLDGIPEGDPNNLATWWRTSMDPMPTLTLPSTTTHFKATVQPPDPAIHKPGQTNELGLTGWMNYGDSMIPISRLPFSLTTTHASMLSIEIDGKGTVRGELRGRFGAEVSPAGAGNSMVVSWSGSDGQSKQLFPGDQDHTAVTNEQGRFVQGNSWINMQPGKRYMAIAEFLGTTMLSPALSEPAVVDVSGGTSRPDLVARLRLARPVRTLRTPGRALSIGRRERFQLTRIFEAPGSIDGIRVVIQNLGRTGARPSVSRVYASKDGVLDRNDKLLAERHVPGIAAGSNKTIHFILDRTRLRQVPHLLIVADARAQVAEDIELNNVTDVVIEH
jgi:hypothetical protein